MQIWLYDEYNWPSGGAGGRVTEGHPELYPRGLDYLKLTASGPRHLIVGAPTNTEPRMEVFEKYLRGFLRRAGASNETWSAWGEPAKNGIELSGEIPEGDWEVLAFFQSLGRNPSPLDDGSNSMTDYLSEKPLRRFLALTHEQYYTRFKQYFGNVIPAVFSDEAAPPHRRPFRGPTILGPNSKRVAAPTCSRLCPTCFQSRPAPPPGWRIGKPWLTSTAAGTWATMARGAEPTA